MRFGPNSSPEGWWNSTKLSSDIKKLIMKKATSINTMMSSKIKDLTVLRRSCVEWRQKEIDKEIVELEKLKKDAKRVR